MTRHRSVSTAKSQTDFAETPVYFDAGQVGRSLREVAVDVIETEGSPIYSRWFHSKCDVELFIWTDAERNVIKHQFTFYGQVVEWNIFEGVKTGVVIEEETGSGSDETTRETIRFDESVDGNAINKAISLVEFASEVKDSDRHKIAENLRLKHVGSAHSDDAFIRRYGEVYRRESMLPSLWKRLRRLFSGT